MRSMIFLATLMAAPLAAVAAGSPGVGDGGLSWDSPAATAGRAGAFILAKRQGGNGTNKDKLDTRITTDPACRGIDPTDRQAKFDCLIGRYHPGQPADPARPPG